MVILAFVAVATALETPGVVGRRPVLLAVSSVVAVEKKSLLQRRSDMGPRELRRPEFGINSPDIYYPALFQGEWIASSTTVGVAAPLGPEFFGGQAALEKAEDDLQSTITYDVRFVKKNGAIVADRPGNIRSLVAATVDDCTVSTSNADPNDLKFSLNINGTLYAASLRTVGRYVSSDRLETSEVVRQAISRPDLVLAAPSIKDIETLCLYTPIDNDTIACRQRTATWLFPSDQSNAVAAAAADGRPIDVRQYDVLYTRKKR